MRRRLMWVASLIFVMLACYGSGSAKEYSLPQAYITAQITSDGAMLVSEERTYHFSGSFSWASMWFPTSATNAIENISIAEGGQRYKENTSKAPGSFQVTSPQEKTNIKWFFRAEDQERTFTISYRIRNAVQVYNDVAQLYWQFIGKDWDIATQHAVVEVTLPSAAPPGSVRVWGHGPLHGSVSILNSSTALWEVKSLPAHTFLEARITFPPELVPNAVIRDDKAGLPSILAEEEAWANQANRQRARARHDGQVAVLVLALVAIASVLFIYKYARPFPSDFQGTYFRELPADYPPVVLGILWRGYSGTQDMAATLLDLLRRQYLQVTPQVNKGWFKSRNNDFILTQTKQVNTAQLSEHERLLLQLLFEDIRGWLPADKPVTTESIKRYARSNTVRFNRWYKAWQEEMQRIPANYPIFDTSNRTARIIAGVVAGILGIAGLLLLIKSKFMFTGGSLLICALVVALCAALSRRHTPQARDEYMKWRAFRRFLRHFSNIKEAPVLSVAIWEHYLVYAVVLGVAAEVIRQLQVLVPELQNDPGYVSSWLFMGMDHPEFAGQAVSSLCNSFVSSVQVVLSQSSSGSGGGGGFSSGGGGGGGGGGGSAG